MNIIKGKRPRPRKILLYGQHGVGKSTWANQAPKPVFVDVEGGLDDLDCERTPRMHDWGSLYSTCLQLAEGQNDFKTICVDTLDWAEKLIHADICQQAGVNAISDGKLSFGKGHDRATVEMGKLLRVFDGAIANGRGVILLAHAKVERVEDPETQSYSRHLIDVHKSISGMVAEWADEVLFACFRVFTSKEEMGYGKERNIGIGGKERYIRTTNSASAEAKNRLNLPDELEMNWNAYAQYIGPHYATPSNIGGLVVNGSSKTLEVAHG